MSDFDTIKQRAEYEDRVAAALQRQALNLLDPGERWAMALRGGCAMRQRMWRDGHYVGPAECYLDTPRYQHTWAREEYWGCPMEWAK